MKRLLLATLIIALGSTLAFAESGPRDGVFIHISSGPNQPHRVLMALNMAHMMSEAHDVLVYFDIDAVQVVLADANDITYAHFSSAQEMIPLLLHRNVTLMVCPGCLRAAGKTMDDVREGVRQADRTAFFNFTEGRILSLDY